MSTNQTVSDPVPAPLRRDRHSSQDDTVAVTPDSTRRGDEASLSPPIAREGLTDPRAVHSMPTDPLPDPSCPPEPPPPRPEGS